MGLKSKCGSYASHLKVLACGTALACIFTVPVFLPAAGAQGFSRLAASHTPSSDSRMLLAADEIVFDRDASTITAQGHVQVEYDGNRVVARHVTYNQKTKRVIASGNVEIVDARGVKVYAEEIDLTDDLGEGFINSLRAETPDKTRFAAESAERSQGQMTVFNNGAYTACQSCYNKPEKDVLWQVRAKRIIWNGATKTMRFEGSQFEMFGVPVAWFPVFEMADPTVKRKSGFLAPSLGYKTKLGVGLTNSYFWNLGPNYDFTLSETGYAKQGILSEGLWRHRLENGSYDFRFAHIYQADRNAFDRETTDRRQTNRYMAATKGHFVINPRWVYGWDILAQSDRNFSRTYNLDGYNRDVHRSQIYLSGLGERNYFDMRFYHFTVQEDRLKDSITGNPKDSLYERSSRQPWVLPRIDYTFIPDEAVYGGELKFTANLQTIYREKEDFAFADWVDNPLRTSRLAGMNGTSGRLTGELEWKRSFISDYGLVLSPVFALRGDAVGMHNNGGHYENVNLRSDALRGMATSGLEIRYPILFTTGGASHIVEPVAQIFVRNSEQYAGRLVNEDAQSFVFDATTLFSRDKFSGYDRVEGGTRANVGVRYSGDIENGWSIYGLAGQSYQLAGRNSFGSRDVTNVGADSGLETARSDYVAMLGIDDGRGLFLATRGRFDEKRLSIRRAEVDLQKKWNPLSFGMQYAYIQRQTEYGYAQDRQEVSVNGSYRLNDNWRLNADTTYDIVSDTLVRAGSSFSYQDECFGLILGYLQTRNPGESAISHKWNFLLSFRTIGDIGNGTSSWW